MPKDSGHDALELACQGFEAERSSFETILNGFPGETQNVAMCRVYPKLMKRPPQIKGSEHLRATRVVQIIQDVWQGVRIIWGHPIYRPRINAYAELGRLPRIRSLGYYNQLHIPWGSDRTIFNDPFV
jgi:hypothetical protein